MSEKWLITGGCGFIGRNLIARLRKQPNISIRVLDNLSVGSRKELAEITSFGDIDAAAAPPIRDAGVELAVGDILEPETVLKAAKGADVIVHLAANTGVGPSVDDPRSDCVTNVIGTLNCLEAARAHGVRQFVFASSGAPVGECTPPIHEELPAHPVSPYGASKLAGEGYCSAYFRTFGVPTTALWFGNVYGPYSGHKSSVVAKFIREAFNNEPWEIYGDGGQTRDFIFVEDLVRAICLAAEKGLGGEVFQIASNRETTVNELSIQLQRILEGAGFGPADVRRSAARLGDVRRNYSDTSKAKRLLGWRAEVSLDEGLQRTIAWFLSASSARECKVDKAA